MIDTISQDLMVRDQFLGPKLKNHCALVEAFDDDLEEFVVLGPYEGRTHTILHSGTDLWLTFIELYDDDEDDFVYN